MASNKQTPGIIGVEDFKLNLKKKNAGIATKVRLGLSTAGLFLQRESQLLVPVDFGVLKASAFTRATGKGFATVVNVGYTAFYAMYVHENVEMKGKGKPRRPISFKDDLDWANNENKWFQSRGNYWDPAGRGQAKFLEAPARNSGVRQKMLNIVKNIVGAEIAGDGKSPSAGDREATGGGLIQ